MKKTQMEYIEQEFFKQKLLAVFENVIESERPLAQAKDAHPYGRFIYQTYSGHIFFKNYLSLVI